MMKIPVKDLKYVALGLIIVFLIIYLMIVPLSALFMIIGALLLYIAFKKKNIIIGIIGIILIIVGLL